MGDVEREVHSARMLGCEISTNPLDPLEPILKMCEYHHPDEDISILERAYERAVKQHSSQRRKSGEPYIIHPLAVAQILADLGMGPLVVAAGLLHDTVEDTDYTLDECRAEFGDTVTGLVDGVTKLSKMEYGDSAQAETIRKMVVAMSRDVRVLVVKLADRVHNARTWRYVKTPSAQKKAHETLDVYAPLANRLGMNAIKTELEELSFKVLYPKIYNEIVVLVARRAGQRDVYLKQILAEINEDLDEQNITAYVTGRPKDYFSIYQKMIVRGHDFANIYDLVGVRIIVDTIQDCYAALGAVHARWNPVPGRFKDYIAMPKLNMYQSLHTTVVGPGGKPVEIQIRTWDMHRRAEFGIAAHWKYKSGELSKEEGEFDRWMKQVREALNSPTDNAVEFLDNFKLSLYTYEIVVFTPKGDSRTLPQGATALDFAYEIHTKIGNSAMGAKINRKIESIFAPISSGDQIEIITSKNVKPKAEWLDHVITTKAKQSIMVFLKKENLNNIANGIVLFEGKLKEFGIVPSARVFRKVLPAYDCATKDEFYSKLGAGILKLDGIEKILRDNPANKILKFWTLQIPNPFKFLGGDDKKKGKKVIDGASPEDADDPEFEIAPCCNPIPGDEVVGYSNPDTHKIDVHKKNCNELIKLAAQHGNRLTPVTWSSHKAMSYLSILELRGIDRIGILMELSQVITGELNTNIRELHIQSHDGIFEGRISLYVKNIKDLKMIIDKVIRIKGVEQVNRVENKIE